MLCWYYLPIILGWDINSANLAEACERAAVLDVQIQDALRPQLAKMKPRPSIYCHDFIAANQEDRANNVLTGKKLKQEQGEGGRELSIINKLVYTKKNQIIPSE